MEVRFCDLCNESVPQADFDQGRAFVHKGRVICASCDRAMSQTRELAAAGGAARAASAAAVSAPGSSSVSAPGAASSSATPLTTASAPAPAPSVHSFHSLEPAPLFPSSPGDARSAGPMPIAGGSRSSAPMWVAVIGLLFTAGVIYAFDRRFRTLDENDRTLAQRVANSGERVARLERLPAELSQSQKAVEERLRAAYTIEVEGLRRDMKELGTSVKQSRDDLSRISAELQAARGESSGALATWQGRVDDIGKRVAQREDELRTQAERIAALEESVRAAAEAAPAAQPANGGAAGADAAAAGPGWKALLPGLTSANSGDRWSAVDGMGQAGDPQATQHLVPLLKDPDVFVRMCAARVLGSLNAAAATANASVAIPALIDALEDADSPVRETAKTALTQITRREINFDPNANDAERAKRLKAVREWWKREEEAGAERKDGAGG